MNNEKTGDGFEILLIDSGIQLKTKSNAKYINRGLLSIATFLKSKGISVNYFPLDHYYMNEGMSEEQVLSEIKKVIQEKGIKFSAISNLFIAETDNTLKIAGFIKDNFPKVSTVIGGINPTIINKELIKEKSIDYIIKGEGEWAIHSLISAIKNNEQTSEIPGLVSKESTGIERKLGNLEELPPLDYSILPKEYLLNEKPPRINIELSRGCSHTCSFCSVSEFWQKKSRSHNPEKVIREFEQLKELGYKGEFTMEEATIDFKSERVKAFLREARKYRDHFSFDYTATRYNLVDDESLSLLDETGFKSIIFGLESASKGILDKINKHIDLDAFVESCKMVKKHKIDLSVFMIVGLPGETIETNKESYDFLTKLMSDGLLDSVFPCYFAPYRGTKAREDLAEIGGKRLAEEKDYFKWLMRDQPLVEYPWLKQEQMQEMMHRMLDLNKNAKYAPVEKII